MGESLKMHAHSQKKEVIVHFNIEDNEYIVNLPMFIHKFRYSMCEDAHPLEWGKITFHDCIIRFYADVESKNVIVYKIKDYDKK